MLNKRQNLCKLKRKTGIGERHHGTVAASPVYVVSSVYVCVDGD